MPHYYDVFILEKKKKHLTVCKAGSRVYLLLVSPPCEKIFSN